MKGPVLFQGQMKSKVPVCSSEYVLEKRRNKVMVENTESNDLIIIPIDGKHLYDLNKPNQPFSVFGRLIPTFPKGEWTWVFAPVSECITALKKNARVFCQVLSTA